MNKNISERVIEIDNQEYTLFLNRTGIVNWEKMTRLQEKAKEYEKVEETLTNNEEIELDDNTNPFELYGGLDDDKLINDAKDLYSKFYWVALYTHHKLTLSQATELFEKAVEEYGIEQMAQLANEMVEEANTDQLGKQRKNLKALKSTQN